MPAKSDAQLRFMFSELRRKREGKPTRTGMSEDQLREFTKGLSLSIIKGVKGKATPEERKRRERRNREKSEVHSPRG